MIQESFKIIPRPPHGKIIIYADDASPLFLDNNQKWIPHSVKYLGHFKVGDSVECNDYIAKRIGASTAFIAKVRMFKYYRHSPPVSQIELLGMPLRWFAAAHFTLIS